MSKTRLRVTWADEEPWFTDLGPPASAVLAADVRELGLARALDAAERADGLAGFIAACSAAREVDDG